MSDQVRINGVAHSWGSTEFKIDAELYEGITSISYSDKLEVAKGYGMGKDQKPRARSGGKYTVEPLVIKCQSSTAEAIREQMANLGDGVSYGEASAPIVLQYLEENDTPIVVEFDEARLVGDNSSDEEGGDLIMVELTFDVMGIARNGRTLHRSSR